MKIAIQKPQILGLVLAGLTVLFLVVGVMLGSSQPVPGQRGEPEVHRLMDQVRMNRGPYPDIALSAAETLASRYEGTPEAFEAKDLIPELRASVAKKVKERSEANAQRAKAAQAAELANRWKYSAFKDEMSGATVRIASILSDNHVEFEPPYDGVQFARIVLKRFEGGDGEIIFGIEDGQIEMGIHPKFPIEIRFDQEKSRMWTAVPSSDHDTTLAFIEPFDQFTRKLRSSKEVRVRVEVYKNGLPTFTFSVAGFDWDRFVGNEAK